MLDREQNNDKTAKNWDVLYLTSIFNVRPEIPAAIYGTIFLIFVFLFALGLTGIYQFLAPMWGAGGTIDATQLANLRERLLVIAALLTSPFLVWRLIVSHWAARAAQSQARIAQDNTINVLFTKAVEQLGSTRELRNKIEIRNEKGELIHFEEKYETRPNTEIRLGAIYALEKLARDDKRMYSPILETICAYIRENSGSPEKIKKELRDIISGPELEFERLEKLEKYVKTLPPPALDVQAAITVIGRRAKLNVTNYHKNKFGAIDIHAEVRLDLSNCNLSNADFRNLDYADAIFDGSALISAKCQMVDFDRASFAKSMLVGANLVGASCVSAKFLRASLRGVAFDLANLSEAEFIDCWAQYASFFASKMYGGAFFRCIFFRTNFKNSILNGGCFTSCSIEFTEFTDANLADAMIGQIDKYSNIELSQAQIDAAWGNVGVAAKSNLMYPQNGHWIDSDADAETRRRWGDEWTRQRDFWLKGWRHAKSDRGDRTPTVSHFSQSSH